MCRLGGGRGELSAAEVLNAAAAAAASAVASPPAASSHSRRSHASVLCQDCALYPSIFPLNPHSSLAVLIKKRLDVRAGKEGEGVDFTLETGSVGLLHTALPQEGREGRGVSGTPPLFGQKMQTRGEEAVISK